MTPKATAVKGQIRRWILGTACASGFLWILTACSGAPSAAVPTADAGSPPSGGMEATSAAQEAMGVYPPPTGGAASADGPKAAPDATGENPLYLPAIINQKPAQYPFEVQQTGVLAVQGFSGCDWIAVGGQVFDLQGAPIQNLVLHLEGLWDGAAVSRDALSGSAAQYGPAGFEFVLGTKPLASTQAIWIQLLDATRKQISPRIYLDTYPDCARNLILVNFVQVR